MMRETESEVITIRVSSKWKNNFIKNHPSKKVSEEARVLLYRFFPIDSKGLSQLRYLELINKANELSERVRRLSFDQEENNILISQYEEKMKED